MVAAGNLFANAPERSAKEKITTLTQFPGVRIERIDSVECAGADGSRRLLLCWPHQERAI